MEHDEVGIEGEEAAEADPVIPAENPVFPLLVLFPQVGYSSWDLILP